PILDRLFAEFDRVNRLHFRGQLPRVPIFLSRKMRRRNGHFSSQPLEIVISRRLCTHGAPGEAEHTVRHEMVHLWQYMNGLPVDHGLAFRRVAHRVDVHPRATRDVKWKGR
ncbi:MAG TPA: SprT-like domain-containing protein, partial [Longimicrobiaceae bacterium]|nr:SprT-like domain-containing protein [Longimicrobiaceae bacterium]